MKRPLFALPMVATLVVAAFLVARPSPTEASHVWSNYHWKRTSNNEVPITLIDSVVRSSSWQSYYGISLSSAQQNDWNDSTVLALTSQVGDEGQGTRKRCAAPSGQVRVCNAAYGFNGWLGLAQIWVWSDGHIAQGVAKMNDSYAMREAEKQYVMCQEIGHTFGLGHQDENFDNENLGTCMDYSRYPEGGLGTNGPKNNLYPDQHDYGLLVDVYAHVHGQTAGATATSDRGGAREGGNTPAEWGRPVRFDRHGTPIAYVKDLGNNQRLVTRVIWARGHAQNHREHD
jgi:hypothetical protein